MSTTKLETTDLTTTIGPRLGNARVIFENDNGTLRIEKNAFTVGQEWEGGWWNYTDAKVKGDKADLDSFADPWSDQPEIWSVSAITMRRVVLEWVPKPGAADSTIHVTVKTMTRGTTSATISGDIEKQGVTAGAEAQATLEALGDTTKLQSKLEASTDSVKVDEAFSTQLSGGLNAKVTSQSSAEISGSTSGEASGTASEGSTTEIGATASAGSTHSVNQTAQRSGGSSIRINTFSIPGEDSDQLSSAKLKSKPFVVAITATVTSQSPVEGVAAQAYFSADTTWEFLVEAG